MKWPVIFWIGPYLFTSIFLMIFGQIYIIFDQNLYASRLIFHLTLPTATSLTTYKATVLDTLQLNITMFIDY